MTKMKECENCKIQFEDSKDYCTQCGQRLVLFHENNFSNQNRNIKKEKRPLNNWIKVFLSILVPGLPLLGPMIGLIFSLYYVFQEDKDRKTFGTALLVGSILYIILSVCLIIMLLIILSELSTRVQQFF